MAIVVSHIASSFDALARQALRQVALADLVELRLDRIGNPGEDKLRALVRELKKPVIVTVHGGEAHGTFAGDVDERFEILRTAARAGAMFFDVDWSLALDIPITDDKQSAHIKITGSFRDPGYKAVGDEILFDRTLYGFRNTVILPAGWELSALSQSGTIGTYEGRTFVALINLNGENNYRMTLRARRYHGLWRVPRQDP